MSDVMLLGVLKMPYEMAMSSELSRLQFHDRAQEAAERIETDAATIESLQAKVAALKRDLDAVAEASTRQNIAAGEVWKERDALRVKVMELEKDAERYRKLRRRNVIHHCQGEQTELGRLSTLDTMVDAMPLQD